MFLVIFLVLVVSAMRIKIYKDNYRSIKAKNTEITEKLSKLEKELKVYSITDQKNKKELQQASNTISGQKEDIKGYGALQKIHAENVKLLKTVEGKLDASYGKYKDLELNQIDLQERHDALMGENSKYRSNNARLLSKIENTKR
jgi:sortase (surface protein transpeptidase)